MGEVNLRTLKDIELIDYFGINIYPTAWEDGLRDLLKQEAIKWVKGFYIKDANVIPMQYVDVVNWIKMFFNITEADLK